MRLVFLGTSDFARRILRRLLDSHHEVAGVITQQDRRRGKDRYHPAKKEALAAEIPLAQPRNVNAEEALEWIGDKDPEIIVVAAYGQILKKKLLNLPPQGCFNVHASLLPKYRGASPVHYALLNGEEVTGVTIQKMVRKLDAGPMVLKKELEVKEKETTDELFIRLGELGAEAIVKALELIEKGRAQLEPQDDNLATYAPSLKKKDGRLEWERRAKDLENFVRAMTSWPGAWTMYHRGVDELLRTKIHKVEVTDWDGQGEAGEVVEARKERLVVATGEGFLRILELTPAAGKQLRARDFINGYQLEVGDRFE